MTLASSLVLGTLLFTSSAPSCPNGHLVAPLPQPLAADALSSFDYPPVAAVTLSYPLDAIRDDRKDAQGNVPGFGQLHPRTQVPREHCRTGNVQKGMMRFVFEWGGTLVYSVGASGSVFPFCVAQLVRGGMCKDWRPGPRPKRGARSAPAFIPAHIASLRSFGVLKVTCFPYNLSHIA